MASARLTSIIDRTMQKYGIPMWFKPYLAGYIRSNPVSAIRHATSFVETRRKKGEITRDHVVLPNGLEFKMGFITELLSLFYYGEERLSDIYEGWSREPGYDDLEYKKRFMEFSALSKRHIRAIRNLMEGIGIEPRQPGKEITGLFDHIESIGEWQDRVLMSGILIKYSFSYTFGFVFFKVFYPVATDFMRSFGKTFTSTTPTTSWLNSEAERIVMEEANSSHILEFTRSNLERISRSIESEMPLAKANGIGNEARLLHTISIAYPLHVLHDLGMRIDVEKEVKSIMKRE